MDHKVLTITLNPSIDQTISVEKLIPYSLNRVNNTRTDPGGKGINVARVLKNFGIDVTAAGLIAGDQGKKLLKYLNLAGISADFFEVKGETRTNIKLVDLSVNKITEINEKGFCVTKEDLDGFWRKYKTQAEQAEIIVVSGSIPPGVPSIIYKECIQFAKSIGKKVILDADGEALYEGVQAVPFAVKPNLYELQSIVGKQLNSRSEIISTVKQLISTGIEIVIVSMGPDGAIVANQNEIYKVDSWDIEIKGSTGAGDSMVAALAYSALKENSLFDIAKITTAAGTITASMVGTQICELNDVLNSLKCVTVSAI